MSEAGWRAGLGDGMESIDICDVNNTFRNLTLG